MTKNGQNWPQNRVFGLSKKIMSFCQEFVQNESSYDS